jgi:hypothetical protein
VSVAGIEQDLEHVAPPRDALAVPDAVTRVEHLEVARVEINPAITHVV